MKNTSQIYDSIQQGMRPLTMSYIAFFFTKEIISTEETMHKTNYQYRNDE